MSTRRGTKTDETGVYRRDDGRYLVVATAKDPDQGEVVQRQKTLAEGSTLEDAIATRDELKDEIRTPAKAKPNIRTLSDYTEQWMKRKARKVKPKTARTYADAISKRVLPIRVHTKNGRMEIGQIPIEDFKRRHVLQWIDEAESWSIDEDGTSYATSTLRKWWRVFRSVIKDLAAAGRIPRDFSLRVDPPVTDRDGVRSREALSLETLHAMCDAAETYCARRHAEIVMLTHTGLRTGELWALRWSDLDRDEQTITIERSVSRGTITSSTKSHRDRVLPLFDPIEEAVDAHRERMMAEQHVGLSETDLMFPSNAGTPRTPGSLRAALETIAAAVDALDAEQPPTPQLIRKSVITALRDEGVPKLAARALVGHDDDRIQAHYHAANEATRDLARVLQKGGDTAENHP